jgi:hypothetical protein
VCAIVVNIPSQSPSASRAAAVEETLSSAGGVNYAEKYARLREDYEKHVQRLMYKLTQEQQIRTHVEERLEEAMVRRS